MRIIELEPRTSEWFKWRRAGLGASDIPVLTGNSPYTSRRELILQKQGKGKGPVISEYVVKMADKVEEDAIRYFKTERDIIFTPICAEHLDEKELRCSLDGWNQREGVLECKYISFDYFNDLKENKKIRPDHIDQMQYQMLVTGHDKAYYYVQNTKGENLIFNLVKDVAHQEKLKNLALEFLQQLNVVLDRL